MTRSMISIRDIFATYDQIRSTCYHDEYSSILIQIIKESVYFDIERDQLVIDGDDLRSRIGQVASAIWSRDYRKSHWAKRVS